MLFPLTLGQEAMKQAIGKIATGPHLSKDLSREEAKEAMRAILQGEIDPIQTAVFLIALRMKRETDDEFLGLLDALNEKTCSVTAPVDEVVILAEPFDGFNRSLPASPFLPALLAACGLPTLSIGVALLGPKYGVTHQAVLAAAGAPTHLSPQACATQIAHCGWAYCDQRFYAPSLYALLPIRTTMIKRTPITTLETVAKPVVGRVATHQLSGYVHPPYARIYALLAQHAGFTSAFITKGVEGGFLPSLRQETKAIRFSTDAPLEEITVSPQQVGITQTVRAPLLPGSDSDVAETEVETISFDARAIARAAAEAGVAALSGTPGATYDALIYGASLALWHTGKVCSLAEGAEIAKQAIANGEAARRFAEGLKVAATDTP